MVELYTGHGKGKTTAALGLVWRMLGAGGRVYVCQFLKPADRTTGEATLAENFSDRLVFERLEHDWDMRLADRDQCQAQQARDAIASKLAEVQNQARTTSYDLIILDEIVFCLSRRLARFEDVEAIIDERAATVELVLTGRDADEALIARADLVTRMENVKHPYSSGSIARSGIEY